jgi:hypothetical protein
MTLEHVDRPEWIDGGGNRGEGFESDVLAAHVGPCAMGPSIDWGIMNRAIRRGSKSGSR